MASTKNRSPTLFARLAKMACFGLGALVLVACGGGNLDGGGVQSNNPPPINPPPINPPFPPGNVNWAFVDLDVISVSTDDNGQTWVREVNGGIAAIDDAQITVDGRPVEATELGNGDVAFIRGTRGVYLGDGPSDDVSTTVRTIAAYRLVVGVIDSVDASHARLLVMGQQVAVTGDTYVYGKLVSEGALAAAEPGESVAVSGFLSASGDIVATRIARADLHGGFLLRGLVSARDTAAERFRIGGLDVDYSQAAIDRQDFTNGVPTLGEQVIVLAYAEPVAGLLAAHSVILVPRSLSDGKDTRVTLKGMVTRYGNVDDFDVAGVTVRLDCFGVDCENIPERLAANAAVKLTGAVDADGFVSAWHLSEFPGGLQSRWLDGETTLVAPITTINADSGALTVAGFQVQASAHTRVIDRRGGGTSTLSAEELDVGDLISAAGTYGGMPGLLIAESIARVSPQDPQVTTFRFGRAEPVITVLGRSIITTDSTRWNQCGDDAYAMLLFGSDFYVSHLTIGLHALATEPVEASWVSIFGDGACQ